MTFRDRQVIVAKWNLERVSTRAWRKLPAQQRAMGAVDADIWVLTETRAAITPSEGYHPLHCPPLDSHDADERMVSIWSRWPIEPTGLAPRARGAVSGIVQTPDGPVAVFGSVIPYAHDKGAEGTSRLWQEHYREIKRLGPEWAALAAHMPVVVAGDLNQDRDGSRVYGTHQGRAMLTDALEGADLRCLTEQDAVATGLLRGHHLIDHVCASRSLADRWEVSCWEPVDAEGIRMSDHPGVVVHLRG